MKKIERRIITVNIFGAVAYSLLITVWALFAGMALILLFHAAPLPPLEITGGGSSVSASNEPSGFLTVLSYLLTAVLAIVTIGIFLTFPYFLAKWSAKALRWSMGKIKIEASRRHLFLAKSVLATLPLLGFLGLSTVTELAGMLFSSVYMATVLLSVIAIGLFLIQLLLARRLHVPADKTW